MPNKWKPVTKGEYAGAQYEYQKVTDRVRTLRAPAARGYVYKNQVWAHSDWYDIRGNYRSEKKAHEEAIVADMRLKQEEKGFGA